MFCLRQYLIFRLFLPILSDDKVLFNEGLLVLCIGVWYSASMVTRKRLRSNGQ